MLYSLVTLIAIIAIAFGDVFSPGQVATMRGYFERNIGVTGTWNGHDAYTGFLIAAPSVNDPNYGYQWQRDAALSMNTLRYTANSSDTSWIGKFNNYITWVEKVQSETDPNGNVLGEPKFFADATPYTGGWCRPQNDGPASRATALSHYASYLIENGQSDKVLSLGLWKQMGESYPENDLIKPSSDDDSMDTDEFIKRMPGNNCNTVDADKQDCGYDGINEQECESRGCCWQPIQNNPNNYPWCFFNNGTTKGPTPAPVPTGYIQVDLNYVESVWQDNGNNCDLWEEVRGPNFYTYMVQYQGMLQGAKVADHFNDSSTASTWRNTASQMCDKAKGFDNNGFISETQRQYDCSIIVGSLYGGDSNCFDPTNPDVVNTAGIIKNYFENQFSTNQNSGQPGTLTGRYSGDSYPGCNSNGGNNGHAWILCSNALGDLYYRNSLELAKIHQRGETDKITGDHLRAYALNSEKTLPKTAKKVERLSEDWDNGLLDKSEKLALIKLSSQMMATQGDAQMSTMNYYVAPCNYHMSEQICENTGEEIGALDLTWSYATVLSAMHFRDQSMAMGVESLPYERVFRKDVTWTDPQCNIQCTQAYSNMQATCCDGQCN